MAEQEISTIKHLLEMEEKASALTLQAQEDADKKIAMAKAQADSDFKSQYEKIISECEANFNEKSSLLEKNKDSELSSYKQKISSVPIDSAAFKSFLDSVLFA